MKRSTIVLLVVIALLIASIAVLARVQGERVAELDAATLVIMDQGQQVGSITLEEIVELGAEEFSTKLQSSSSAPRENIYTGVPLLTAIEAVQPGLVTQASQVSVMASDGYAVSYSGEEMLQTDHIYLVWMMDGEPLGTKAEGGSGPLLVIPRQHEFSQFWCKFAAEVDVQ